MLLIKVNTKITSNKAKAHTHGPTDENTKEGGTTTKKKAKADTPIKMVKHSLAYGKTVEMSSGFSKSTSLVNESKITTK